MSLKFVTHDADIGIGVLNELFCLSGFLLAVQASNVEDKVPSLRPHKQEDQR